MKKSLLLVSVGCFFLASVFCPLCFAPPSGDIEWDFFSIAPPTGGGGDDPDGWIDPDGAMAVMSNGGGGYWYSGNSALPNAAAAYIPTSEPAKAVKIFCGMMTEGGGWTLISFGNMSPGGTGYALAAQLVSGGTYGTLQWKIQSWQDADNSGTMQPGELSYASYTQSAPINPGHVDPGFYGCLWIDDATSTVNAELSMDPCGMMSYGPTLSVPIVSTAPHEFDSIAISAPGMPGDAFFDQIKYGYGYQDKQIKVYCSVHQQPTIDWEMAWCGGGVLASPTPGWPGPWNDLLGYGAYPTTSLYGVPVYNGFNRFTSVRYHWWDYNYTVMIEPPHYADYLMTFSVGCGVDRPHIATIYGPQYWYWNGGANPGQGPTDYPCWHPEGHCMSSCCHRDMYYYGQDPCGAIYTPNGYCPGSVHWTNQRTDLNIDQIYNFGFTAAAPPHIVTWKATAFSPTQQPFPPNHGLINDEADWSKPVCSGDGPVCGPCEHVQVYYQRRYYRRTINIDDYMFRGIFIIDPIRISPPIEIAGQLNPPAAVNLPNPQWNVHDPAMVLPGNQIGELIPGSASYFDNPTVQSPIFHAEMLPPGEYGLSVTYDYDPDDTGPMPSYRQVVYTTFEFVPDAYTAQGDIHQDGVVNLTDLAVMANNWLLDCNTTPIDPACISLPVD